MMGNDDWDSLTPHTDETGHPLTPQERLRHAEAALDAHCAEALTDLHGDLLRDADLNAKDRATIMAMAAERMAAGRQSVLDAVAAELGVARVH